MPLAVVVLFAAGRVPESIDLDAPRHLDLKGAAIVALGLALLTGGLIEAGAGWTVLTVGAVIAGCALLVTFVVVERRSEAPMLPPSLFRSRQFTGANLVTLAVYAGLGGAFFFVVVNLQDALGYSALESGAALTPVTVMMLLLSSHMGALSQRTGPRLPMTVGPAIVAIGLLLLGQIEAGDKYLTTVLPAALVFGLGLSVTVAPLTAAVLGAVDEHHLGVGSATNNAVARLAGLLAVAVIPSLAGFELTGGEGSLPGYTTAMRISAALAIAGSLIAALTIERGRTVTPVAHPIMQPCQDPALTSSGHR